jgi:hypothetical protein
MNAPTTFTAPEASLTGRTVRHAAIRAQGHGDKLDRLVALLEGHRASLNEVIRLAAYPPDRIAAISLKALDKRARATLRAIDATLDNPLIGDSPYGSLGDWGANGSDVQIRDMLSSARFYASREPLTDVIRLGLGRVAA